MRRIGSLAEINGSLVPVSPSSPRARRQARRSRSASPVHDPKGEDDAKADEKDRQMNRDLLGFRRFLPRFFHADTVALPILQYLDVLRFGVLRERGARSCGEVQQRAQQLYGVQLGECGDARTAVNGRKMWFLPGWFLMSGAEAIVLCMRTVSNKKHHVLVSGTGPKGMSISTRHAWVYDSGSVIPISSSEEIKKYLHLNSYSDPLPIAIGYSKTYRDNQTVHSFLDICRVYYDIARIPNPGKAGAARRFARERRELLDAYFERVSESPMSELRFKDKFVLSRPAVFAESDQYTIQIIRKKVSRDVAFGSQDPLEQLRAYAQALPLYAYERKKKQFPHADSYLDTAELDKDSKALGDDEKERSEAIDKRGLGMATASAPGADGAPADARALPTASPTGLESQEAANFF